MTDRAHLRVGFFVAVACGSAWLVALPLYLVPGLRQSLWFTVFGAVMMVTPAVALLVTRRFLPAATDPRLGWNPGHPRGWWKPAVIGVVGIPLAVVATLGLAAAVGFYHADLFGLSGFRAVAPEGGPPVPVLVAISVVSMPYAAVIPNALFAAGEEFGWRGFLQPELTRFSPRWGIVLTGTIWGLWHAPLLLLGYNFPELPAVLRLVYMVVGCVLLSGILGILKETGGTVWVSAVTHGALNSWAGLGLLFVDAAHPFRFDRAGILGVCGWAVLAVFYLLLRFTLGRGQGSRSGVSLSSARRRLVSNG